MTAREIIAQLVDAMNRSAEEGCTDHLDCCDDAGEFWYTALHAGETYLKGDGVSQPD